MKIGELARRTATSIETVRYYEREGLLPGAGRTAANYRIYGADHVDTLSFIRRCRSLDMTLDEIRRLLALRAEPGAHCAEVNRLVDEHIEHVTRRIAELRSLEDQLLALRHRCGPAGDPGRCGILEELDATAAPAGPAPRSHLAGPG